MRDRIEFSRDDQGWLMARTDNGHFNALATQLISDIIDYAPDCLELLQLMDQVRSGQSPIEEFEGNSSIFRATPDGVTVQSLGPSRRSTTYTFDEARTAVLKYFDFLRPSEAQKKGAVARWENEFGRPYPGRAELGIS
jgi:hypothetical protein